MKNYEEMNTEEKRKTLGEIYFLYTLYVNFENTYNGLPDDLKEKLNKEFESDNKPSNLIRHLSIVVSNLHDIAKELYKKTEQPNKEEGEER